MSKQNNGLDWALRVQTSGRLNSVDTPFLRHPIIKEGQSGQKEHLSLIINDLLILINDLLIVINIYLY